MSTIATLYLILVIGFMVIYIVIVTSYIYSSPRYCNIPHTQLCSDLLASRLLNYLSKCSTDKKKTALSDYFVYFVCIVLFHQAVNFSYLLSPSVVFYFPLFYFIFRISYILLNPSVSVIFHDSSLSFLSHFNSKSPSSDIYI